MNNSSLFILTGLMGDALKELEASGNKVDDRTMRLLTDAFVAKFKTAKLPIEELAISLARAVHDDEVNHGGLTSKAALKRANEIRLAAQGE